MKTARYKPHNYGQAVLLPLFITIAEFISQKKDEILTIFVNVLMVCSEPNPIGGETFALDGCKLGSDAAKEWSGTFADLKKKKDRHGRRPGTIQ